MSRRTRPSVAKVKLEIDVLKPLVEKIWIEFLNGDGEVKGFWQSIIRERLPAYCVCCSRFGHLIGDCWRAKSENGDGDKGKNTEGETPEQMVEREEGMVAPKIAKGRRDEGVTVVGGDAGGETPVENAGLECAGEGLGSGHGPGSLGPMPDEATLAHMADGIILEGVMGHLERIANVVMNEGEIGQCKNKEESGSEGLMEYEDWVEKMKSKMGQDMEGIKIIEGAKHDVMSFFVKAQGELGIEEFERRKEDLVEEANQLFVNKISILKGKYDGIELNFVSPNPTKSPFTPNEGRIRGVDGIRNSSSVGKEVQKKKFDVEEWAIDLNKIWEEDEEMWNVMDDMFEELKKFLETFGGIKKV